MKSINNPLDVLSLDSLKHLNEHLKALWMQIASGEYKNDQDWETIDADSLSAFEDDIKSFQEVGFQHDCYQQLISKLFAAYYEFVNLEKDLDGHYKEIGWCEEAKWLIIRYLSCVIKYTLFDGPENCAYNMAKEIQQKPRDRELFLLRIGDALGIRDTIKRIKVSQCCGCKIIPCEGRYIDGLCGLPELAVGASIYKPVYASRSNGEVPIAAISEDDVTHSVPFTEGKKEEVVTQSEPPAEGKAEEVVAQSKPLADGKRKGTKIKSMQSILQCVEIHGLLDELRGRGYCKYEEDGRQKWLKNMDSYSYLLYKVTEVFAGKDAQIEIEYISDFLIWCPGDRNTQSRYARGYRGKEKNPPGEAALIDRLVEDAKAGHLSRAK